MQPSAPMADFFEAKSNLKNPYQKNAAALCLPAPGVAATLSRFEVRSNVRNLNGDSLKAITGDTTTGIVVLEGVRNLSEDTLARMLGKGFDCFEVPKTFDLDDGVINGVPIIEFV